MLAELETALAERGFAAVADAVGYAHRAAGVEPVAPGRARTERPVGRAGAAVAAGESGEPGRELGAHPARHRREDRVEDDW